MTKLEQIQSSIEKLSVEEIAELRDWLDELDGRLFDEKIERDAKAGKLDKLHIKDPRFQPLFDALPADVREVANRSFALLKSNPKHPSLHFKCLRGDLWSARRT